MKRSFISILITLVLVVSGLESAPRIDRQAEKRREAQKKINRERGFQDIEVDNLHGDIQRRVRILHSLMGADKEALKDAGTFANVGTAIDIRTEFRVFEQEDFVGEMKPGILKEDRPRFIVNVKKLEGEIATSTRVYSVPLGLGISVPGINQKYLYVTTAHLFTVDDGMKLTGIVFQFDRVNALGAEFQSERRLLINPSPEDKVKHGETDTYVGGQDFEFAQDKEVSDPGAIITEFDNNGDIMVQYYEANADTVGFPKVPIFVERLVWPDYATNSLHAPMPYSKQLKLLEGYKNYLRKTKKSLGIAIRDYDLKRRDKIGKMLDFLNSN